MSAPKKMVDFNASLTINSTIFSVISIWTKWSTAINIWLNWIGPDLNLAFATSSSSFGLCNSFSVWWCHSEIFIRTDLLGWISNATVPFFLANTHQVLVITGNSVWMVKWSKCIGYTRVILDTISWRSIGSFTWNLINPDLGKKWDFS